MVAPMMDKTVMKRSSDDEARAPLAARILEALGEASDLHKNLGDLCKAHGRTIASRWQKRPRDKRKALFSKTYPNMREAPFDTPPAPFKSNCPVHESFLNVDDMTTGSNFISLLAARTLYTLSDWAPYDHTVGYDSVSSSSKIILHGDDSDYGTVVSTEELIKNHIRGVPRGMVGLGQGVLVLEFQMKVLKFLDSSVRLLLQDMDLSKAPSAEAPLTMDDIIDLGARSPLDRYRFRAFSHPPHYSKEDVFDTLLARVQEVQDNIILLRTDPIYFHARFQAKAAHDLDKFDKHSDRAVEHKESNRWDDLMEQLIIDEYQKLELWSLAWRQAQILHDILDENGKIPDAIESSDMEVEMRDARARVVSSLKENGEEMTMTMIDHPPDDHRTPVHLGSKTERALAKLDCLLHCVSDHRWILEDALHGAPNLRHVYRRIKTFDSSKGDKYLLLKDLSRKEVGPKAIVDVVELLEAIAGPSSASGVAQIVNTQRVYVVLDELVQKDTHQRSRLSLRIMETLCEQHIPAALIPQLALHPDRHHLLTEREKGMQKRQINEDLDTIMSGTSSTRHLTVTFQDAYLFDGKVPSLTQERRAQKALAAIWDAVDEGFKGHHDQSLTELYKDFVAPAMVSPEFAPHMYDFTSLSQEAPFAIPVKKKAFRVWHMLFAPTFEEKMETDIAWDGFVLAMRQIGFTAQHVFATEWRFTPTPESPWPVYPISIQEPMPGPKIMWQHARFIAKRLFRHYGLQRSTFVLSE